MGLPIRMLSEEEVYFVTSRTLQSRFLLRPSEEVNDVVGGVLAKAAMRYGVEVHAFFVASNHVHLIVTARGDSLPRFMGYFLGNVARKVGPLVEWTGRFWGRRYSAEPILDDEALIGRLRYVLAHGVKEGLVRHAAQWPGLSSLHELLGGAKRVFHWFNWTHRWNARRKEKPEAGRFSESCAETVTLELRPLPLWRDLEPEVRERKARELLATVEEELHGQRTAAYLGAEEVKRQRPHDKPAHTKRSPRPLCHSSTSEGRRRFKEAYREFVKAFKEASARWREGDAAAPFPLYAFRPGFLRPPSFDSALPQRA